MQAPLVISATPTSSISICILTPKSRSWAMIFFYTKCQTAYQPSLFGMSLWYLKWDVSFFLQTWLIPGVPYLNECYHSATICPAKYVTSLLTLPSCPLNTQFQTFNKYFLLYFLNISWIYPFTFFNPLSTRQSEWALWNLKLKSNTFNKTFCCYFSWLLLKIPSISWQVHTV